MGVACTLEELLDALRSFDAAQQFLERARDAHEEAEEVDPREQFGNEEIDDLF